MSSRHCYKIMIKYTIPPGPMPDDKKKTPSVRELPVGASTLIEYLEPIPSTFPYEPPHGDSHGLRVRVRVRARAWGRGRAASQRSGRRSRVASSLY